MNHKNDCLICHSELVYSQNVQAKECYYCHKVYPTNTTCSNGHFVCDHCHSASAIEVITTVCLSTELADPVALAAEIMKHPAVKMHGPEHHYLVPAVLLTGYYNAKNDKEGLKHKIEEALKRSQNVLGGFCGFYGSCGAAIGTGIFMSLITEATPLSNKAWRLSNLMTSCALQDIAEAGGPRCCKRDTYTAIIRAIDFVKEHLEVNIPYTSEIICEFDELNRECKKKSCKFYKNTKV